MRIQHSHEVHDRTVKSAVILAVLGALCLTGCHSRQTAPATPSSSNGTSAEETTRLVDFSGHPAIQMDDDSLRMAGIKTDVVGMQNLRETVRPTGQIAPTDTDSAQVTSRLPGRVVQALVSVGDKVQKGQLIATVDSVDLTQAEATYQTALSHLNLTYNQLDQQRKLAGYGSLSEQPIEDARRALSAAESAVAGDAAQLSLDRTTYENAQKLVSMGELTRKPLEDAQNAFAQAQGTLSQSQVNLHSARSNLDRATVLFNGGVFSKQQMEDAETAFNNARSSVQQNTLQAQLASEELERQKSIYRQNLNGAAALQTASSKYQQDQHTYQNDLVTVGVTRKEFQRAEIIHQSGIPVSQALQQAQDAYDEARVALQGAASTIRLYGVQPGQSLSQLGNGHVAIPILAPISGLVVSRTMLVGQMTDITTPLVKIVNLDRVYVDAQVYEKDLAEVAVGDPVQVHVAAFPDKTFNGRVHYIGNEVSPDTRTLTVRTIIANPGWLLRPGMFATVLIGSHTGVHNLSVPSDAVMQQGNDQVVYVQVAPRQFLKRIVRTGPPIGSNVPI
ncbi:MAG: efflux RND transporter periplasmic adaptor subunit, partial [Armatimonadota bacterium]|nr:efflux RND transporter periplasmic adaptor subunit [Armatimonadota bacterium]